MNFVPQCGVNAAINTHKPGHITQNDTMTKHSKAYLALIFICIVWGTTYLAIRLGVRHYPAFLFAGIRQLAAGIILVPIALYMNRQKDLSRANILRQMLMGFLMLTVGNGGVTWAEQYIPSGIAALLCSMMPIFAVLFNLGFSRKEHFNMVIGSGMLLGVGGTALIFRNNISDLANPQYLAGMLCVLLATSSWALGSALSKRVINAINPLFNAGLQLAFGGIFMLIGSPLIDDYSHLDAWNTEGLLSLIYLITFGSVAAYAAYMYSLKVLPVGIATIYAYINPLIAVVAGYLFLDEPLNMYIALAFVAIVASVYIVNLGYKKAKTTIQTVEEFPEGIQAES